MNFFCIAVFSLISLLYCDCFASQEVDGWSENDIQNHSIPLIRRTIDKAMSDLLIPNEVHGIIASYLGLEDGRGNIDFIKDVLTGESQCGAWGMKLYLRLRKGGSVISGEWKIKDMINLCDFKLGGDDSFTLEEKKRITHITHALLVGNVGNDVLEQDSDIRELQIIHDHDIRGVQTISKRCNDEILGNIKNKGRVLFLGLSGDGFTERVLSGFRNLQAVALAGKGFSENALESCNNLRFIELYGSNFTDNTLKSATKVSKLILSGNQFTDKALRGKPNLTEVIINHPNFTSIAFSNALNKNPFLRKIGLGGDYFSDPNKRDSYLRDVIHSDIDKRARQTRKEISLITNDIQQLAGKFQRPRTKKRIQNMQSKLEKKEIELKTIEKFKENLNVGRSSF